MSVVILNTNPSESALNLSSNEAQSWLEYGGNGRSMLIKPEEMVAILFTTDPALEDLRKRVQSAVNITTLERDTFILASRQAREGELEVDASASISMGDDNGAYVSSWSWISFVGTPLERDDEAGDENTTPVETPRGA